MREGWEIRKLGELLIFDKRFNGIPKEQQGTIAHFNHVSAEELKSLKVDDGNVKLISTGQFDGYTTEELAGSNLNRGEIITIPTGGVANIKYYTGLFVDSGNLIGIARDNSISLKYVYYGMTCKKEVINSYYRGVSIKHPFMPDICKITLPIPPVQQQEKIVAELDSLTSIIEKKKQQLEELDKLAKSIFYDMFGSSEYQKGQLISLCADKDDIKCGPFGTQLSKSEFLKDGVPVWGIPQVNSNFAIPPTDFVSEEKALALQSFSIIGGDIVMSRKGNIGQSAIYPTSFENGILHSDVLRIRVKRELANPLYLVYQFHQSAEIKHQFKIIGYGAIMPGLNVSKLKSVIVDIPPITLQNEFAKKIKAIEKQKELVKRSIVETETLFNSRMDYWFN